jgi:dipeptidyl aminopeptidase/acylaminoacyl peptidase
VTAPSPITPETLVYGFANAGDPQVSPDGSRLLYAVSATDRETEKTTADLWLSGLDGAGARRLTHGGRRNGGARWSPDGATIAFVSDRSSPDHPDAKSGIHLLPVGGGEARPLTGHLRPVADLAWSPDGATLAYTTLFDPEDPEEAGRPGDAPPPVRVTRRLDYKQDNRGYLNDARLQVWLVDVASGRRRMLTADPVDHNFPQWSPDGKTIAVKVPNRNGMCSQLALVDVATGAVTMLGSADGQVAVWAWSPGGDRILLAGDTRSNPQSDFFLYDVATGETKRLTDDLECLPDAGFPTISAPSQPVWLDDRKALVHAMRAGSSGLYELDTESGEVAPRHRWEALHGGLSTDRGHRYVAQSRTSLAEIGEVALFDRETGEGRVVTRQNADVLAERPPAEWERFAVERGGFTVEAWLLKPPGFDPNRRYPVVLDVHGGPHGSYGYAFTATQQILATNGFLVVYSNPRGSSTYGRHFAQQVINDWGGEDYLDLMAVVDAVLERPYADASRTGIYGYSYGGYMVAWTIGQTDRFKAAVCGAPCFDLESMYGTSDIGHIFGDLQWGGPAHERPEWFAAHSPSSFAHRATTPTLIVHGEADDRCPIGQGEQMFVALKKAGCEVEFVRYPGGSHLMLRGGPAAHRLDYFARILGWFRDHLGGPV